ncbi:MAG: DUF167 domain-containing protein [Patescibacteria group bacterium]
MILSVTLIPSASQDEIVGWVGSAIKIRIAAPPVDGKANAELLRFLAKRVGLAQSDLAIVGGQTSKHKRIEIPLAEEDVRAALT